MQTGKKFVNIKFTKIACGARRSDDIAKRHLSFDANVDVEVTMGDQTMHFEGFAHEVIPRAVQEQDGSLLPFIMLGAVPLNEILMGSNIILNVAVPAAVAAAMGKHSSREAAELSEQGGFISTAIPGARERAEKIARLAVETNFFPLYEYDSGKVKVRKRKKVKPVETYLKEQGRFQHLNDKQIAGIQKHVDEEFAELIGAGVLA